MGCSIAKSRRVNATNIKGVRKAIASSRRVWPSCGDKTIEYVVRKQGFEHGEVVTYYLLMCDVHDSFAELPNSLEKI